MYSSAYVTYDPVAPSGHGAGEVCYHEIQALKRVSILTDIIARSGGSKTLIEPFLHYGFNPFLADYFASQIVPRNINLLHLSCSPGLAILEACKPKHYVVNVVAHDLKTSIDEHEMYYGKGSYQFIHNTDKYLHNLLLKHAEKADCILTPSTASANWINSNIPNRKRVCIISHGIDSVPEFNPVASGVLTVGYLGAFGPDKGLIYLLQAWKEGIGELVFGGNCKEPIESLIKQYNVPQARTLGWVENLSDFYNLLSVYIQPSVTEGFGIEILEAMSYGRPVICAVGAGGADAISDGVDGFIVPIRDSQAILERIQFFKDNPEKIIEFGLKAREKAKNYTWDKIEVKYEKLYTEVLNG
jgi:glycosyltransferase involved in cell wall biosynthesis